MAYIKKIQENGATIYPVTITNAVIDPETGETLSEILRAQAQVNELYESAGAVYNSNTETWELNGLTDITNAQMKSIYAETLWMKTKSVAVGDLAGSSARTNIQPMSGFINMNHIIDGLQNFARGSLFEIFHWGTLSTLQSYRLYAKNIQGIFYGCAKLKKIIGIIDLSWANYATDYNNCFSGCAKLEDVSLYGVKYNLNLSTLSSLSVESATYLLANANTSNAFSVTFNAGRQVIFDANADFVAAKNTHTNITINYL